MATPKKQWLSIREIRTRVEEDRSFRFQAYTEYSRYMLIHYYMLRGPEAKKLFVRNEAPSSGKSDVFALKENLSCSLCRGPFASDEAAPEMCQSCCSVWHPQCLPLMPAGTSAARQVECSECVKAGGHPHHLELEAGPPGQGTTGEAHPASPSSL